LAPASEPRQTSFSYDGLNARMPVVREMSYLVNARVRPLLAFWIGRDNVGNARLTWREGSGGRRGFELLIGSDPARAPRHINRWGFILEELDPGKAELLDLMNDPNQETLEAAEAEIARQGQVSTFKASRTTIAGNQAVHGFTIIQAPSHLTYLELDSVLPLIPAKPSRAGRTLELPPGTQRGFLASMDTLLRASVNTCGATKNAGAREVSAILLIYGQTLYDLSLSSCRFEPELRIKTGTFADVIDGRFQVRNRTTKDRTRFRVSYGSSGELRGVPVRVVFRPHWWMEVEMLLHHPLNRP
jgi:hypothetical protein